VVSADGRVVVTTRFRNTLVWDLTDPAQPEHLLTIDGHVGFAITGGGAVIETDRYDRPVAAFDITAVAAAVADPLGRACAIVLHGLSNVEWDRYATGLPYQEYCPA